MANMIWSGPQREYRLADLYYQYLPKYTSMAIWNNDMSLPNSPQVELLRLWLDVGWDWPKLMDSRLAHDRRYRHKRGASKWTESRIQDHITHRVSIYKSIKKHGFRKSMSSKQPIAIMETPLVKLFDVKYSIARAPEIYHGGRRCAAMYVLGHETVTARPGIPESIDKYKGAMRGR